MKYFKIAPYLIIITIISVSFLLMSTTPLTVNSSNKDNIELTNNLNVPACAPHAGWKEVEVWYRTSGNYTVQYSDLVSGVDPDHDMTWGCGSLDLDEDGGGWECNRTATYFYATGATYCQHIAVASYLTPTQGNPVTHTIDFRVKDDEGHVSNWGGITLVIKWRAFVDTSEPYNPCNNQ